VCVLYRGIYPGESTAQLLLRFQTIYEELNHKLANCEKCSICAHWTSFIQIEEYGLADAMLFGHLARASYHELLGPLIQKQEHIIRYINDISDVYFGRSVTSFADFTWQVSLYNLLENPFLATERADWIKETLTENLQNFNPQQIFEINHSHDETPQIHPPVLECCQTKEEQLLNEEHTHNDTHFVMSTFGLVFTSFVSVSIGVFLLEAVRSRR